MSEDEPKITRESFSFATDEELVWAREESDERMQARRKWICTLCGMEMDYEYMEGGQFMQHGCVDPECPSMTAVERREATTIE